MSRENTFIFQFKTSCQAEDFDIADTIRNAERKTRELAIFTVDELNKLKLQFNNFTSNYHLTALSFSKVIIFVSESQLLLFCAMLW